jgi:hypothetical protein
LLPLLPSQDIVSTIVVLKNITMMRKTSTVKEVEPEFFAYAKRERERERERES